MLRKVGIVPVGISTLLCGSISFVVCDNAYAAAKKVSLVPCIDGMRALALPSQIFNGENTIMRGQFSQFPEAVVIPREYTGLPFRHSGIGGDPLFPAAKSDEGFIRLNMKSGYPEPQKTSALMIEGPKVPISQLTGSEKLKLALSARPAFVCLPVRALTIEKKSLRTLDEAVYRESESTELL